MTFVRLASGTVLETDRPDLWPEAERISRKEGTDTLRRKAEDALRPLLTPNGNDRRTVYTLVTHASASGMSRCIRLFVIEDNQPRDITGYVARALGYRVSDRHGGVVVTGCGMDMGFHVVRNLGYHLFPNGTNAPHSQRNGKPDTDGGYAILQRWL